MTLWHRREAVGIVNYKTKKQEAEKKLENTQNNLERLEGHPGRN